MREDLKEVREKATKVSEEGAFRTKEMANTEKGSRVRKSSRNMEVGVAWKGNEGGKQEEKAERRMRGLETP